MGNEDYEALDVRQQENHKRNDRHEQHLQVHEAGRHSVLVVVLQSLGEETTSTCLAQHVGGTRKVRNEVRNACCQAEVYKHQVQPGSTNGRSELPVHRHQGIENV